MGGRGSCIVKADRFLRTIGTRRRYVLWVDRPGRSVALQAGATAWSIGETDLDSGARGSRIFGPAAVALHCRLPLGAPKDEFGQQAMALGRKRGRRRIEMSGR